MYVHIVVLYLRLIILSVGDDVSVDSKMLLMTDFINLKIKLTQSFRCAYMDRVCVHVIIDVSVYEYLCLYCIFFKKNTVMQLKPVAGEV
jgi:hypothetical protein